MGKLKFNKGLCPKFQAAGVEILITKPLPAIISNDELADLEVLKAKAASPP